MFDLRVAAYKRHANNDGFLDDAPQDFFLAHLFAAFTVEHYRVRQPGSFLLVDATLKIKQKCTSICPEPFRAFFCTYAVIAVPACRQAGW